ncbi:hypothetical protein JCM10296v2_006039 [Rhodotorula toruloides]
MSPATWDSEIAPHIRLDTRIVLTHGDLQPCNILVRDGHLAALIDWELAGWWPEELEAAIVLRAVLDRPTDMAAAVTKSQPVARPKERRWRFTRFISWMRRRTDKEKTSREAGSRSDAVVPVSPNFPTSVKDGAVAELLPNFEHSWLHGFRTSIPSSHEVGQSQSIIIVPTSHAVSFPSTLTADENGTSRAIKQGKGVLPEEAEVTHWVWTNTSVPVPQVMHADATRSTPRLEFEYINGKQLDTMWPTLAASKRQTIADELVRAIQAMQDAPPPANGLIGSYQRLRAAPFRPDSWSQWPPYEPTTSAIEFFDWPRSCALAIGMTSQTWDSKIAPHIRLDTKIVLTHGNLFPRNILIRDGHLAAIVDWELAGWWPVSGLQFFRSMDIPPAEQANVEASRFVADCVCRARGFSEHEKRAFWADLLFTPSHYGLQ